jgi:hypothetical protein
MWGGGERVKGEVEKIEALAAFVCDLGSSVSIDERASASVCVPLFKVE